MFELFIIVTLGVIVGLSAFTVLTVVVMLQPKVMEMYLKYVFKYCEKIQEFDYDELYKEVKEV